MHQGTPDNLQRLSELVDQSQAIACFTGAGISTESGIPDFRSPDTGLWNKIKPIQFQDFIGSEDVRKEAWSRKFSGAMNIEQAQPNAGHRALAKLIDANKCIGIITQNIDNLHQNSGVSSDHVVELHGNGSYASCLSCGQRYELDDLKQQFEATGNVAPCTACGGIIKSATISFGQAMPEAEMLRAQEITEQCDLMIVLGSSLSVYPAAGFPEYAKRLGAKLAIVNREPTPLDGLADVVIHEQIGLVMAHVVGLNE